MDRDELYGLALDRFVPERTALVRALRAAGQREEAASVAALGKPSVAAWAVNQLVRTEGSAVSALFAAGDALADAQADVVAGRGDGRSLRGAVEREREAVKALLDAAGGGLSGAIRERVADTLHAAALDPDARALVSGGRLVRELQHAGLGAVAGGGGLRGGGGGGAGGAVAGGRPGRGRLAARAAVAAEPVAATEAEAARRLAAEREAAARARAEARRAARIAEGEARRRAESAVRALRVAEQKRDRAAEALSEAEAVVDAARREVDEAGSAHERAKAELEGL